MNQIKPHHFLGWIVECVSSVDSTNYYELKLVGCEKIFFGYYLPAWVRRGMVVDIEYVCTDDIMRHMVCLITSCVDHKHVIVCPECHTMFGYGGKYEKFES